MNEENTNEQTEEVASETVTETVEVPEVQVKAEAPEQTEKKLKKKSRKTFLLGVLVGALLTLVVSIAALVISDVVTIKRYRKEAAQEKNDEKDTDEEIKSIINTDTTIKMSLIEKEIKDNYYKDVDMKALQEGVYYGMMDSLGDPYSTYYSQEEIEEVMEESEGIYYGIGAYVSFDTEKDVAVISGIISGTPAEEAGLQADDIIYKVDGVETLGMSTNDVVNLIRGEEHTKVIVTVIREGEDDFLDIEVERRKIESPTVNYEMKEGDIGYIQITEFDDVTTDQFTEAMAVLKGQGMKGLILDLRSNGGGNFSTCVDIAQQLLPEGLIVYTEDKYGEREEYYCDGKREFDKPLVVLVNGYTASASEILTGAIKDYGIGTVMGTTTFGKGIVQAILSLRDGSAIKVTISRYFTPSGKNIHEIGIEPDIEVKYDSEAYKKDGTDNQLEAAMEEINKQLK